MAVAYAASGTVAGYPGGSTATSVAITTDAGVASGDLLVAVFDLLVSPGPTAAAAGWTFGGSATVNGITGYLFWRYATSGGAQTHTFTWSGGAYVAGIIHRYTGSPALADPFGGSLVSGISEGSTIPSQAYTASGAGLGVWLHGGRADSPTVTVPSGYTTRSGPTVEGGLIAADRADTSGAKTTGAGTTNNFGPTYVHAGTLLDAAAGGGGGSTPGSVSKTFAFLTGDESFTATAGAATTMTYSSSVGNPAGSLQARTFGRNKNDTSYWEWTGTWEALGVPAGATVTSIQLTGASTRCSEYTTGAASTIGPYELRDSAAALIGTLWTGRTVSATSASWTVTGSQAAVAVPSHASTDTVKIRLADSLKTGANNSAAVTTNDDQVALNIAYTVPVAGAILPASGTVAATSGTSGSATVRPAAAGTVAGTSTSAGSSTLRAATAGTVAAVTAAIGAATGLPAAAGTTPAVSATTGAATSTQRAAGTTAGVSTASAAVTTRLAASGICAGTSGAAGSARVVQPAAGTVAATSAATGATTARLAASGTTAAMSGTTGSATVIQGAQVYPASGTVAATSGTTGAATTLTTASGSTAATSSTSGAAAARLAASGSCAGISGTSGAATVIVGAQTYPAAGTVDAVSEGTGSATALLVATGTTAGTSGSNGTATTCLPAAGTTAATTGGSGSATSTQGAAGTTAAVSGTSGSASIIGGPQVYPAAGVIAAVSGSSGSAAVRPGAAGTVAATSSTSGQATARLAAAGTTAATSSTSAAVTVRYVATGITTASTSSSGVAAAILRAAGVTTGLSDTSGQATGLLSASSTVTGVSGTSGAAGVNSPSTYRDVTFLGFDEHQRPVAFTEQQREVTYAEHQRAVVFLDQQRGQQRVVTYAEHQRTVTYQQGAAVDIRPSSREFYDPRPSTDPPVTAWEASFDDGATWQPSTTVGGFPVWLVAGKAADPGAAVAVLEGYVQPLVRAVDNPEIIVRKAPRINVT